MIMTKRGETTSATTTESPDPPVEPRDPPIAWTPARRLLAAIFILAAVAVAGVGGFVVAPAAGRAAGDAVGNNVGGFIVEIAARVIVYGLSIGLSFRIADRSALKHLGRKSASRGHEPG